MKRGKLSMICYRINSINLLLKTFVVLRELRGKHCLFFYLDFAGEELLADVGHDGFALAIWPYEAGTGVSLLLFAGGIYLDNINAELFGPEIYA